MKSPGIFLAERIIFMRKIFALLFVFLLSTFAASAENIDVKISVPGVGISENIEFAKYDTWPQASLKMNIFAPADGKKHPAVVFIPGGAWIAAPKVSGYYLCMKLAENGFAAASIEYRVIGAADYTEIIADAKAAVRFLRANADKFNIDADKIAAMGQSAGGYLAVMLGVAGDRFNSGDNLNQSSAVQAVVDFFGPTDLTKIADDYSDEKKAIYYSPSSFPSIFANGIAAYKNRKGGSILDTPETAHDSNPLNYISKNTPPFLIFHGDSDKTVSPSQSKILHEALNANGIDSTLYIINGGEHDGKYFYQPEVMKIITDFLNRVLK